MATHKFVLMFEVDIDESKVVHLHQAYGAEVVRKLFHEACGQEVIAKTEGRLFELHLYSDGEGEFFWSFDPVLADTGHLVKWSSAMVKVRQTAAAEQK